MWKCKSNLPHLPQLLGHSALSLHYKATIQTPWLPLHCYPSFYHTAKNMYPTTSGGVYWKTQDLDKKPRDTQYWAEIPSVTDFSEFLLSLEFLLVLCASEKSCDSHQLQWLEASWWEEQRMRGLSRWPEACDSGLLGSQALQFWLPGAELIERSCSWSSIHRLSPSDPSSNCVHGRAGALEAPCVNENADSHKPP